MHQGVYEKLKEMARAKGMIYYSQIAPVAGVGQRNLGPILGEVCQSEVHQGRPMLGAVVVRKDSHMPGEGFFKGARKLGLFQGSTDKERREFWGQELKKVHGYWSSH
jgi:hypothetical protein